MYAPTSNNSSNDIVKFFEDLEQCRQLDPLFIMGNINAKLEKGRVTDALKAMRMSIVMIAYAKEQGK